MLRLQGSADNLQKNMDTKRDGDKSGDNEGYVGKGHVDRKIVQHIGIVIS
jgi:hypothetical protein